MTALGKLSFTGSTCMMYFGKFVKLDHLGSFPAAKAIIISLVRLLSVS